MLLVHPETTPFLPEQYSYPDGDGAPHQNTPVGFLQVKHCAVTQEECNNPAYSLSLIMF